MSELKCAGFNLGWMEMQKDIARYGKETGSVCIGPSVPEYSTPYLALR